MHLALYPGNSIEIGGAGRIASGGIAMVCPAPGRLPWGGQQPDLFMILSHQNGGSAG